MRMRSGRSWSLLITYLAQFSLMGSRSKTTTSTWKCLLLIWSSALGSTLTGEQWTKKNGSGWAWGLAQSGLEHCEGTLFSNLIFEIKLQSQSEFFSNIIISTKCQYSSEVSKEGGVVIDDYAGVSWGCQRVSMMITNTFYFNELSQKWRFGHEEGGVTIDDNTGVSWWSLHASRITY